MSVDRAGRLITSTSSGVDDGKEIGRVAEVLRSLGLAMPVIADAIVEGLESTKSPLVSSPWRWMIATTLAACAASIAGTAGIAAISIGFNLGTLGGLSLLPLLALVPAAFAIKVSIRAFWGLRRARREKIARAIARALLRRHVSPRVALEAGAVIAEVDVLRLRALVSLDDASLIGLIALEDVAFDSSGSAVPRAPLFVPATAAIWAVASFWVLYFLQLAFAFKKGGFE